MLTAVPTVVSPPLFVHAYVEYILSNSGSLVGLTLQHISIIVQAIAIAVPLGVVVGTLITYNDRAATVVLWLAGVMMTVPSIALFGLLIPTFGIGKPPVIVALVLYSQLPVIRNTYVGLDRIDPAAVEAGTGLGMTRVERLRRVKLPMALPVIMAGVRNAVVVLIGIAAIGAFIGAGGLGDLIFNGVSEPDIQELVVGTVVLSLLTLAVDYGFGLVERVLRLRNGEDVQLPRLVRGAVSNTGGTS
ncbi:ABC transporter permease [Halobaculum magnesiiphilum]|uniref:ABC transporter permease n=1 Tax=Halobaculum magnesiiphilum TaxID=1017351 RepID=A0A8T8WIL9_9EURY|nr:ABC transporter permease [Halobaculum magnesiiphilum]QZP39574.1 ABC transporter permease [Halobaculum magnesiiphilum]